MPSKNTTNVKRSSSSKSSKPKAAAKVTKSTATATQPKAQDRSTAVKAKPSPATPAAKTKPAPAGKIALSPAPSREQISVRAYEIWLRKGRPLGQDEQNWLEAEAELKLKS